MSKVISLLPSIFIKWLSKHEKGSLNSRPDKSATALRLLDSVEISGEVAEVTTIGNESSFQSMILGSIFHGSSWDYSSKEEANRGHNCIVQTLTDLNGDGAADNSSKLNP